MAERRRILKVLVVLALLGGFAWLVLRRHELEFGGKPLSRVLLADANGQPLYSRSYYAPGPWGWGRAGGRRTRAERALRTLGTNALPLLVRMAGARPSVFRMIVGAMAFDSTMDFLHLPPQNGKHEVAAWAFKVLGPEGRPAVPALIRLLGHRDPTVRMAAADCLAGIGPEAREAVPALVQALKVSKGSGWNDEQPRAAVAHALGEIGPAAGAAVASLANITNEAAQVALIKISQGSFDSFFARLKDTSDPARWTRTAFAVALLGTNAEPAIPLLLAALEHTNNRINAPAVQALGRLHRRPDLCLAPLASLLDSTNGNVRWSVFNALADFGQEAKPVVPRLIPYLSAKEPFVRDWATNAMKAIDPEALKGGR